MLIQTAIKEFLMEQEVRGNSDYTIDYYALSLGMFVDFLDYVQTVEALTVYNCKEYYLHLKKKELSSVSVQTYIRSVRAFLSWLYRMEYITEDLTMKFKLPTSQRKVIDTLTDREISDLMNCFDCSEAVGLRNYCICALMLDSGLRLSEAVTLLQSCLHIPESYIIVNGKGNKQRIVPLGQVSKKALTEYISLIPFTGQQRPLFLKPEMMPIQSSTIKQLFAKLKKRFKIGRLHTHLLRHTFATRFLENGGDLFKLQMILGHTSLEMVKRYVHLNEHRIVEDYSLFSPLDVIGNM